MNAMINKMIGAAGASVMAVAFVSLFAAMGASGSQQAKSEAAHDAMPLVKMERIEVVAQRPPHDMNNMAMNTRGVKAHTL